METVRIYKLFLPSHRSMILTVSSTLLLILTAGIVGIYYDNQPITDPGVIIKIEGNADFLEQAAINSWPGDGTQDNPIIIQNLHIYGITISKTKLHFELRNNKITGINVFNGVWKGGLILNHVADVLIADNEIAHFKSNVNHLSEFTSGILIFDSQSIIVRNNQIEHYPQGIKIIDSENMIFSENSISDGNIGVSLFNSGNILFKDGLIERNSQYGVKIESGFRNIFGGNTFKNNDLYSVILEHDSKENVITRNNMFGENLEAMSQASDSGNKNEFLSNFWSDFNNQDVNKDGFVDFGYWISGKSDNKDYFPASSQNRLDFDFYNNLGVYP